MIGARVAKTPRSGCNVHMARGGGPTRPDWLVSLRNAYAIHNVLGVRPELPFFVVRWDGQRRLEWMDLSDPRQRLKPFHFEIYFGKEALRDRHYLESLARACQHRKLVLKQLFGFWDLFYPIATEPAQRIFLYVGQFYR